MLKRVRFFDVDGLYSRSIGLTIEKMKIRRRIHIDRERTSRDPDSYQKPRNGQWELMSRQTECAPFPRIYNTSTHRLRPRLAATKRHSRTQYQ